MEQPWDHSPSRAIEQARTPQTLRLPRPNTLRAVLDTNVALDWLVFADRQVQGLRAAIESGQAQWWANAAMRTELAQMLAHRDLAAWAPNPAAALDTFDRLVQRADELGPAVPPAPRCRDADDQIFIDLALACDARWLVTRDRALLALDRQARARGVEIVTPSRWALPDPESP
jgi:putative PIN family toxin of toxin-antitoxin system